MKAERCFGCGLFQLVLRLSLLLRRLDDRAVGLLPACDGTLGRSPSCEQTVTKLYIADRVSWDRLQLTERLLQAAHIPKLLKNDEIKCTACPSGR